MKTEQTNTNTSEQKAGIQYRLDAIRKEIARMDDARNMMRLYKIPFDNARFMHVQNALILDRDCQIARLETL